MTENSLRPSRNQDQGFTLIELLVGMVIMGILAMLSFSGWSTYQRTLDLNGSAQEVLSTLRNAQERSLAEAATYCVTFNTTNRSYQLTKFACGSTGTSVGGPKQTKSSRVQLKTAVFQQPGGTTANTVLFYPRGSATKGAVTVGRDGGGRKYTIAVEGLTGRVSING